MGCAELAFLHQPIEERPRDKRGPVVREVGSAQEHRRCARLRQRGQDRHVVHVERIERSCVSRIGTPVRPTLVRIRAAVAVRPAGTAAHRPARAGAAHRSGAAGRARRAGAPVFAAGPRRPAPPAAPAMPPCPPLSAPPAPAFERQPCARIKSPASDNGTSHGRDWMGPRMNVGEATVRNGKRFPLGSGRNPRSLDGNEGIPGHGWESCVGGGDVPRARRAGRRLRGIVRAADGRLRHQPGAAGLRPGTLRGRAARCLRSHPADEGVHRADGLAAMRRARSARFPERSAACPPATDSTPPVQQLRARALDAPLRPACRRRRTSRWRPTSSRPTTGSPGVGRAGRGRGRGGHAPLRASRREPRRPRQSAARRAVPRNLPVRRARRLPVAIATLPSGWAIAGWSRAQSLPARAIDAGGRDSCGASPPSTDLRSRSTPSTAPPSGWRRAGRSPL